MKIVVTGSSGLVGSALVLHLRLAGHEVLRLVRGRPAAADELCWDPRGWQLDQQAFAGVEAVVHLAGEPIAEGRWSDERKELIRQSRVDGTRFLSQALASLAEKPKVLVSASAVGFYGDRGDEELTEESPVGFLFLSEVCRQWEAAADPARQAGIRVVHPRLGMVLSAAGGALEKMLPPFRMGLGARLGSGKQWMSFIHLLDLVRLLAFAVENEELAGPVNAVCAEPLRNRDFTDALAAALGRKARLAAPAWALRARFGEMADEVLLSSARVLPRRLESARFPLDFPTLEAALREILGDS
jgi:uncharacterized protein